jgi:tetratricopeptide (TPR) repeat protein
LSEADVDQQLMHINTLETKVLLDEVDAKTEKDLRQLLKEGTPQHHYFLKIYPLARHYEHFLLIRLREKTDQAVSAYLEKYRRAFARSQEIYERMQSATSAIVGQYKNREASLAHWEHFLWSVVQDEDLDGLNRYAASVRLAFLLLNEGAQNRLEALYDYVDQCLRQGLFYSRRILSNYYANQLLFTSRFASLDAAEQFGYLSLRFKNADYLFYLTNLSAVLQRRGKSKEALRLMREAFPELRSSTNPHARLGFIAFYLKCMSDLGRFKEAEEMANDYLKAYPKQVQGPRWHLFFVAYFRALMAQERYGRLLYLTQRYKIRARERANRNKPSYLPTISWYIAVAEYIDEGASEQEVLRAMQAAVPENLNQFRKERLYDLLSELKPVAPRLIDLVKSGLN